MLPKKSERLPVPTVCIQSSTLELTCCGRSKDRSEHVFLDAEHAVTHYAASDVLLACPDCVAIARPFVMRGKVNEAFATRGLEKKR